MVSGTQESKTDDVSQETTVYGVYGPQVYFHPGSATLLCVDAQDTLIIEQEHEKLSTFLEAQKQAQNMLDEINYEMLTQSGKRPQRVYESKLKETYDALNEANAKLKEELKVLTAKVPEGELLDENSKTSAIGIMELIPLKKTVGFKITHIRSDKIKNHWRKYKLSEVDKKSGEASFIKYENKEVVTGYDGNGNEKKKKIRSSTIDTDELKKQLKEVAVKFELELVEDSNIILFDWAEKMNKRLTWPQESDSPDEESIYQQYVDISVQAQLMRYSQGVGLSAEFNPLKKKVSVKVAGHASFALGEAKASASFYIPDRLGVSLLFPARMKENITGDPATENIGVCSMGALRYSITTILSGNAGASLAIELGVTADASGEMAKGYGIKGSPAKLSPPPPPGKREFNLSSQAIPDTEVRGEIGAFAGVQVGGNIKGAIEWFDPNPEEDKKSQSEVETETSVVSKEKNFTAIATLAVGANLQSGIGVAAAFYITFINGKFRIRCKAGLCWGVGAKGSLEFEVDGKSYLAFMKSFLYMLRNVDYQKLEKMMARDTFQSLCAIPIIMAACGIQSIEAMLDTSLKILQCIKKDLKDEDKRVNLMKSILDNPDQLKYTPPETKGAVIAILIDNNWVDLIDPRNQNNDFFSINSWKIGRLKLRKQAVFMVLKWVQSQADYNNVMQHLTVVPGESKGSMKQNEQAVIKFLGTGERDFFFYTNYGEKLALLYDNLPASVNPDAPFIPIPERKMAEYLAMIDSQPSPGTRTA